MPSWLPSFDIIIGGAEAFLFAFAVVGFDCHNNVRTTLPLVATIPVYRVPIAYLIWTLCGAAAVAAFVFSATGDPANWVNAALSLGVVNNFVRGLTIGTSVLVLIRSKVLSAGGSDIGGEYFYNMGRVVILRAVARRRARDRETFLRDDIDRMLTVPDFEADLIDFVSTYMAADPEPARKELERQFRQVQTTRPGQVCLPEDPTWRRYYRSLAGVAVDFCGVGPISKWVRSNAVPAVL
jgi:hypothetical protein